MRTVVHSMVKLGWYHDTFVPANVSFLRFQTITKEDKWMRQSVLFAATLREAPADAEIASHQWLLRAGFIRQLAAGIYTYLPLGRKVLYNIERIVREEIDGTGAQEILMPALQPAELWKESGRYTVYGPELIRLQDRHHREFALGPTHEEVITYLVNNEISSYRRLPVTLYQIQTKFRDERRPRFGLLRSREFLMKDAYSFHTSWESLDQTYRNMVTAYTRIFQRCGLHFEVVEADAGAIGGEGGTHEFMALTGIGEDTIVTCTHCDYAANLEKSHTSPVKRSEDGLNPPSVTKIHTPDVRTIEQLTNHLQVQPQEIIKTLIYKVDGNLAAVLVRGDHEVNETKLKNALQANMIEWADFETTETATGAPVGFAGPLGLKMPIFVDAAVAQMSSGITGANEVDTHFQHVVPGRDFSLDLTGDYRNVVEGDKCPQCNERTLQLLKGIEIGHVFKLGTKYSETLQATYLDSDGKGKPFIMGCYGIGVSRLMSAIAEQHHDDRGLVWPSMVAPFQVHIIPISMNDHSQIQLAEQLYVALRSQNIDVLMDDREERAGVKFKDADLIGIPIRIVVGKLAAEGNVEYVARMNNEKRILSKDEALANIKHDLYENCVS